MQKTQEPGARASLEELTAFLAVAHTQSFTAAGLAIGRDPTIVSKRIAQLEKRLGVRLLTRTTRQVSLTEAGQVYFRRVLPLMDELDSASQEVTELAAQPQGVLRVAVSVTFGRQWVAPALGPFLKRYPRIAADVRFSDRYLDMVADGFDVAIRLGSLPDSSLIARHITPFRNYLYASSAYLKEHGTPKGPQDLKHHSCLGFTSLRTWPDWILTDGGQEYSVRPHGPLMGDSSEALMQAAIDGLGIVLVPDWLAVHAERDGQLERVLPGWRGPEGGVYAVTPPGRLIPFKTRVFIEDFADYMREAWHSW